MTSEIMLIHYQQTDRHKGSANGEIIRSSIDELPEARKAKAIHSKNHQHDSLMYGAEICLNCPVPTCNGKCGRYKHEMERYRKTHPRGKCRGRHNEM